MISVFKRCSAISAFIIMSVFSTYAAACDLSSVKGDYWFVGNGSVERKLNNGSLQLESFAELGKVFYDGKGAATLIDTVAFHSGQSEVQAKGTYVVSADCRASIEWRVNGDSYLQTYALMILGGGAEIATVAFRTSVSGGSRPLSVFTQRRL